MKHWKYYMRTSASGGGEKGEVSYMQTTADKAEGVKTGIYFADVLYG